MRIIDQYVDLSFSQTNTSIHQYVAGTPQSEMSRRPGMPKKTRLERMFLSETTTAVMRVNQKGARESTS